MHKNLEIIPSSNNHRFAERNPPSATATASFGRVYDEVRSNTPPKAKEKTAQLDKTPQASNSPSREVSAKFDENSHETRVNTQKKAEITQNKSQSDKVNTIASDASDEINKVTTDTKPVGSAAALAPPEENMAPLTKAAEAVAKAGQTDLNMTGNASLAGVVIDYNGNSSPSLAAVSSLAAELQDVEVKQNSALLKSGMLEGTATEGAPLLDGSEVTVVGEELAEGWLANAELSHEGLKVVSDNVQLETDPLLTLETDPLLALEGDQTGFAFKHNAVTQLDDASLNLVNITLNNAELESTTDELDWVVAQMVQKGGIPYTGIIKPTDKVGTTLTTPAGVAVNLANISDMATSIDGLVDAKTGLALAGNTDNIKNMTMLTNVDQNGAVFTSVTGDGDSSINLDGELIVTDMDIDPAKLVLKNSDAADLLEGKPNQSNTLDQRIANMAQSLAAASLQPSHLSGQTSVSGLVANPVPSTGLVMNVPPTHQNWAPEMGEKVVWMARAGVQSAEIRLDPPELGSLIVKLSMENDSASVSFIAATPQVRDLLEGQMHRLREMLSQQGLDLTNVDVNVSHQQAGAENGDGDAHNGSANHSGEDEDLLGEVDSTRVSYVNASGVDFYA